MSVLSTLLSNTIVSTVAITAVATALAVLFKKIPNDIFKAKVFNFFKGLGVTVTLGLTKWKYTSRFWNSIVEPWVIDFIDNTVGGAVEGFIAGLRTDNKE